MSKQNTPPADHNLYVGDSCIHGIGVYARQPISRGNAFCYLTGHVRHQVYVTEADGLLHPNEFCIGQDLWLDPDPPFCSLNHSCEPNCAQLDNLALAAIDDIAPDTELTIDYSRSELFEPWRMRCSCGSPKCRNVIASVHAFSGGHFRVLSNMNTIPLFAAIAYESNLANKALLAAYGPAELSVGSSAS